MKILGLTGSIGMGKSVAAQNFRYLGVPVYDADRSVHELLRVDKKLFLAIAHLFPHVVKNGKIDRLTLGNEVFKNKKSLSNLEDILHPLVTKTKYTFLYKTMRQRASLVVLEIPLLFETKGDKDCDGVIVVSAPSFVQKARVLSRPGMTMTKFRFILDRQISDKEKQKKADFVLRSGLGRRQGLCAVRKIISITRSWPNRNCYANTNFFLRQKYCKRIL